MVLHLSFPLYDILDQMISDILPLFLFLVAARRKPSETYVPYFRTATDDTPRRSSRVQVQLRPYYRLCHEMERDRERERESIGEEKGHLILGFRLRWI